MWDCVRGSESFVGSMGKGRTGCGGVLLDLSGRGVGPRVGVSLLLDSGKGVWDRVGVSESFVGSIGVAPGLFGSTHTHCWGSLVATHAYTRTLMLPRTAAGVLWLPHTPALSEDDWVPGTADSGCPKGR